VFLDPKYEELKRLAGQGGGGRSEGVRCGCIWWLNKREKKSAEQE